MISKLIRWSLALAAASVALPAAAQGKFLGVTAHKAGTGAEVQVNGEGLGKPKEFRINRGGSYILEFNASMTNHATRTRVGYGGLSSINYAWYTARPPKIRVHFKVSPDADIKLDQNTDGWAVTINGNGQTEPVGGAAKAPVVSISALSFPDKIPPIETHRRPHAATRIAFHGQKSAGTLIDALATSNEQRITLDFANTDVVQILKALAMQANVNIVTSPDVKGTLTVSLDNVTVKEGLDLVTTLAGAKYAKVGNTYVVTSAEKFSTQMVQLNNGGREQTMLETRVIPIYSGDAQAIRASVLSSLQEGWAKSKFQILLPTDEFKIASQAATGAGAGAGAPGGDSSKTNVDITGNAAKPQLDQGTTSSGSTKQSVAVRGLKEQYLILVGPREGIDEVEGKIHELDKLVLNATGSEFPTNPNFVRATYTLKSDDLSASDLVKAVTSQGNSRNMNVDLFASPTGQVTQSIVIVGRDNEVKRAESMLQDLDQTGYGTDYFAYQVKYVDPRSLREELIAQVKGLRVSVPPGPAGNPSLYKQDQTKTQANEQVSNQNATGQTQQTNGATQQGTGAVGQSQVNANNADNSSLSMPFSNLEATAAPMRLLLRGTKEQIEQAIVYLTQVDVPSKQVALEMRVMELTKEDAINAGIDWNLLSGGVVKFIRLNNAQSSPSNSIGGHINDRNIKGDVVATLDQIANKSNLIARPNLIAMDGRQSEIFIGDAIRYVESIISSQQGPSVTTNTVRVGVRLSVLPRVGGNGSITLDLRPVVSFLTGFTQIPAIQGELPQTSERIAQSTLNVLSGDTIAIGGLIQDQDIRNVSGLPILMNLPIVGQLFRKTTNTHKRTELVIFLTAREIESPAAAETTTIPMRDGLKGDDTTKRIGGGH